MIFIALMAVLGLGHSARSSADSVAAASGLDVRVGAESALDLELFLLDPHSFDRHPMLIHFSCGDSEAVDTWSAVDSEPLGSFRSRSHWGGSGNGCGNGLANPYSRSIGIMDSVLGGSGSGCGNGLANPYSGSIGIMDSVVGGSGSGCGDGG